MGSAWRDDLVAALGPEAVRADEPMAAHTTFKIGGPAEAYVRPAGVPELAEALRICRAAGVPWRIVGCGSDVLVADAGLSGVTIEVRGLMASIEQQGDELVVGAGATNEQVAEEACAAGLAGYEFASGIPGTVGGAAIMNAGAYGGEFKDVCTEVTCLDPETGELVAVPAAEAAWSYRHSAFDERGLVVVSARLRLASDSPVAIRARMDDLASRRAAKQPLDLPSAGSTFKRPEGHYAAALIDEAGLRGLSVGGAQVSTKHTGFVVNAGNATAADVRALIAEVQRRVLAHAGVALEPEVRFWGFESE